MNKSQLIEAIASEAHLTKAQAKSALEAMISATTESLRGGENVSLVGFGSFKVVERKARMGMNPKTHEKIEIPACRVVRFKPGADLEAAVK